MTTWSSISTFGRVMIVFGLVMLGLGIFTSSWGVVFLSAVLLFFLGIGVFGTANVFTIWSARIVALLLICASVFAFGNLLVFGPAFSLPRFSWPTWATIPGRETLGEDRIEWNESTMGAAPREVAAACLSGENEFNLNNIHYRCVDVIVSLYGPDQADTPAREWDYFTDGIAIWNARVACVATPHGSFTENGVFYDCQKVIAIEATLSPAYGDPRTGELPTGSGDTPLVPAVASLMDKCTWLRANFPQTTEAIQAFGAQLAGVEVERVLTHAYRCSDTSMAFDGFIIAGPNEGPWTSSFSLPVPVGGVVDVYGSAGCTGMSEVIGPETDTKRCFDGTATGVRATYWPWLDENPPVSGMGVIPSSAGNNTTACVDPKTLATKQGWTIVSGPDTYGGLVVTVTSDFNLPDGWMAQGPETIDEDDTARAVYAGQWTIYPAYSCREALGYEK